MSSSLKRKRSLLSENAENVDASVSLKRQSVNTSLPPTRIVHSQSFSANRNAREGARAARVKTVLESKKKPKILKWEQFPNLYRWQMFAQHPANSHLYANIEIGKNIPQFFNVKSYNELLKILNDIIRYREEEASIGIPAEFYVVNSMARQGHELSAADNQTLYNRYSYANRSNQQIHDFLDNIGHNFKLFYGNKKRNNASPWHQGFTIKTKDGSVLSEIEIHPDEIYQKIEGGDWIELYKCPAESGCAVSGGTRRRYRSKQRSRRQRR